MTKNHAPPAPAETEDAIDDDDVTDGDVGGEAKEKEASSSAALRASIAGGTYRPSAKAIASGILRSGHLTEE
jgi:hypothetical protein